MIAAVVIGVCTRVGLVEIDLRGKSLTPLLVVALFSPCIYFIGETIGISHTTASESGVFLACIPVASLGASVLLLKKKPSKRQVLGILITSLGVMFTVFAVGLSSSFSLVGYMFLLVAVVSYALYSVFVDKANAYTGVEITLIMLVVGAIVFGVLAVSDAVVHGTCEELISLPFRERSFAVAIVYQGVGCSILAFLLSNVAISKIGVNRTASFIGVATVVSILAGVILLGESFSIYQIVGVIMIIAGVYTANSKMGNE